MLLHTTAYPLVSSAGGFRFSVRSHLSTRTIHLSQHQPPALTIAACLWEIVHALAAHTADKRRRLQADGSKFLSIT
jgi:hypothetical protein